jgi:hypothetical protein
LCINKSTPLNYDNAHIWHHSLFSNEKGKTDEKPFVWVVLTCPFNGQYQLEAFFSGNKPA